LPREYSCGDIALVPRGDGLEIREASASMAGPGSQSAKLGWHDSSGDHYVTGPQSPVDVSAIEFVVPGDAHHDARRHVYDTSGGTSRSDWRLMRDDVCTLRGGDTDVLTRYTKGATLEDLARDLSLGNRDDAREIVHRALLSLQRRYYADR
jgi:hypothetical protein